VTGPQRRVLYEVRALQGDRLATLGSFRALQEAIDAPYSAESAVLSIWSISELGDEARIVAVRNRGDLDWTVIE
jgi:hypothetical protein